MQVPLHYRLEEFVTHYRTCIQNLLLTAMHAIQEDSDARTEAETCFSDFVFDFCKSFSLVIGKFMYYHTPFLTHARKRGVYCYVVSHPGDHKLEAHGH
jgi:hypothetical protein